MKLLPATVNRIYDFPMGDDVVEKPKARPLLAGAAVLAVLGGALLIPTTNTVPGVAVANPVAVADAVSERKVEAEKVAAERKRQDDERALHQLEVEVLDSMRKYFDQPANNGGARFVVASVALVKTADTLFEGMARMSVNGRQGKDVVVHVTADDRNLLWKTDDAALLPLFR